MCDDLAAIRKAAAERYEMHKESQGVKQLVSRCPCCKRTWPLPEPHGGTCPDCYTEVEEVDASTGEAQENGMAHSVGTDTASKQTKPYKCALPARTEGSSHLKVVLPSGTVACTVAVGVDMSVKELKEQVAASSGIPVPEQRLFIGHRELVHDSVSGSLAAISGHISLIRHDPRWDEAERLIEEINVRDPQRQISICNSLGDLGHGAARQFTALLPLLDAREGDVRQAARRALDNMGPDTHAQHIDALAQLLTGTPASTHYALVTMSKLGEKASSYALAMAQCLNADDESIRCWACKALSDIAPFVASSDQVSLQTAVSARLADDSPDVRQGAIYALFEFGCVVVLADALSRPFSDVRLHACEAIGNLSPDLAGPYAEKLAVLLRDDSRLIQAAACTSLGRLGRDVGGQFTAELVESFLAQDPHVRDAACKALVQVCAASALSECLDHKDPGIRRSACWALGCLGSVLEPSHKDALLRLCGDSAQTYVRGVGMVTIGSVAREALAQICASSGS
eukprot:gnl/TRDRNA2_/TRDRNA2_183374_c0_seq1.p1 gnl/TRDRNA2_/TRDRNA2_183374_c0~~gnl/TRDRNA2_/TRDRNA2_183374_c0_seq1.p1  ORF type:complete len:513 (+),score=72.85 gnl/TRDRNA2_/TRDRNA2_183374_c0_seq1:193-1731(+)